MEAYFIIVSDPRTLKRLELIDVAEKSAALAIYKDKTSEGNHVSLWKATKIRGTTS